MAASRFDYVKYDGVTQTIQDAFKKAFIEIENGVDGLMDGRAKSLAYTKLEEAYMWIGKALRDDQIQRNGSAELQESRG